ncbi:MAG: DUF177 domain-containing protein [Ruminococcus sp.]|nr:DUF177 domain-containing protein [Ruminococcus sp.]
MILQLKRLFDNIGESEDISFSITQDELEQYSLSIITASPIRVSGRIYNRAGVVMLDYNLSAELEQVCDRCLKDFVREYSFDISYVCVSGETDNDEYLVCTDFKLDLTDAAITDLLLRLPTKILCREDCRGLCPVCGADLNLGDCGCGG